jgi:hypothetical protein
MNQTLSQNHSSAEFVEKSLEAGIPVQSLVGLLTARGWTEKQAYSALARHHHRQTGIEVPLCPGSGAAAVADASACG